MCFEYLKNRLSLSLILTDWHQAKQLLYHSLYNQCPLAVGRYIVLAHEVYSSTNCQLSAKQGMLIADTVQH